MTRHWIAHLDMDAFFASVELLRYPMLRGRAVAVGGRRLAMPAADAAGRWSFASLHDYQGRGVVTTASYEARTLGVHSGMSLMKAAQAAAGHEVLLLPANFADYRLKSKQFKAAVRALAPLIEDRGIDEIFIDLGAWGDEAPIMARKIQQAVRQATDLSCSLGLAENKLMAKLASAMKKPEGITVLDLPAELPTRVWPLPVGRLNGVGPKAREKLARLQVLSIGDLAQVSQETLLDHFGRRYGQWLWRAARGEGETTLTVHREPQSVSRETTFERDMRLPQDRPFLTEGLNKLCAQVAEDLRQKNVCGRTVGIKVRYGDFKVLTRDFTLPQFFADAATIRYGAGLCLKRTPLNKSLRLLGVKVSHLQPLNRLQEAPAQGELDLG